MNYTSLGSSELEISEVSFGCMSLGTDQSVNSELIRKAYESGINFFDTADLYDKGWNEETVGKAIKSFRDKIYLATKVGNEWNTDGSGWEWNPSKKYILEAVEKSLARLQTDYIDLYQLHGGTIDDPIDETIEAFEILKTQGKIRAYGISSIRPNVIREWVNRSNIDSVMMQYSLLDRRPEEECLDLLKENNIGVLTRGSLAKGILINKPAREYMGYTEQEVSELKEALDQTGHPLAASLQFVLSNPSVSSVVAGLRTNEQLEDIIRSLNVRLPNSSIQKLGQLLQKNYYTNHR